VRRLRPRGKPNLFEKAILIGLGICVIVGALLIVDGVMRFLDTDETLDVYGQKGIDGYKELTAITLPAGAIGLKGEYVKWMEWHFYIVFWSPTPPTKPPKAESQPCTVESVSSDIQTIPGRHYPLKNPRAPVHWQWTVEPGVFGDMKWVVCDDGYYIWTNTGTM
jgi:hypothetical protein